MIAAEDLHFCHQMKPVRIEIPQDQNWSCHGCTDCCRNQLLIRITPEEKEREKKFQEKAGATVDTTKPYGWTHSVIAGANLTQASFTNWVGGGNNALNTMISYQLSGVDFIAANTDAKQRDVRIVTRPLTSS